MNLNWLLVFIPVGVCLNWFEANPLFVFLASALAIIPLAGLMGDATERLCFISREERRKLRKFPEQFDDSK